VKKLRGNSLIDLEGLDHILYIVTTLLVDGPATTYTSYHTLNTILDLSRSIAQQRLNVFTLGYPIAKQEAISTTSRPPQQQAPMGELKLA
jgi:hypothetical protein